MPAWLEGADPGAEAALHEIVLASQHPDDLTLRQARLLGMADAVIHEQGIAAAVLDRARADAVRLAIMPGEDAPQRQGIVVVLRASRS